LNRLNSKWNKSNISINSHRCHRLKDCRLGNYYCEMIEIHMRDEGNYKFISHSTKNLFGYIYENNFTLFHLNINAIKFDDDSHYSIELFVRIN